MQSLEPATLYFPAVHTDTVPVEEPAGQVYPAEHTPAHVDVVCPSTLLNLPAGHEPLQSVVASPATSAYLPAAHRVQDVEPATLYLPRGQIDTVDESEPAGHVYPAEHGPEHDDVVCASAML